MEPQLTTTEIRSLRRSLVEDGYCIIRQVMDENLVQRVRDWSDALLSSPDHQEWGVKFQGTHFARSSDDRATCWALTCLYWVE